MAVQTLLYRMLHEHYLASWWPRKRLQHNLIMSKASGYRYAYSISE